MRPVRLELTGFSAYRATTVINFTDADLHVFVGPTGAGKSSVIDGIVFALYGAVPRYGKNNVVAPAINQLATEARVRLDFSIGSTPWTAVRVVRRTASGASTKEARLIRGFGTDDEETVAGNTTELDAAIVELLGLTVDQFTKTAILPQGAFARFLSDPPAERQTLLRRLLGMERFSAMASAARARATSTSTRSDTIAAQLHRLDVPSEDELRAAEQRLEQLAELDAELSTAVPRLRDASHELARRRRQHEESVEVTAALAALRLPDGFETLAEQLDALDLEHDEAERCLVDARAELAAREKGRVDEALIDEWRDALASWTSILDAQQRVEDRTAQIAEATEAAAAAAETAQVAASTLDTATHHLEHVRQHVAAVSLREALVVGERCPVCNLAVEHVPDDDGDGLVLDDARIAVDAARNRRDDAVKTASTADATVLALVNERDDLAASVDAQRHTLAAKLDDLQNRDEQERLDVSMDPGLAERIAARLEDATVQRDRERLAADQLAAALSRRDAIDARRAAHASAEATIAEMVSTIRSRFGSLAPPPAESTQHRVELAELVRWAETTAQQRHTDEAEIGEQLAADDLELTDEARSFERRAASLGVTTDSLPNDVDELRAAVGAAHATILTEHRARNENVARAATLAAEIAELDEATAVATELGRLLGARGFEQWLLNDVVADLAARASTHLVRLARGRWTIDVVDGEFVVIDHRNADEIRSARTLSGGETFLTSLSLALALADSIAELSVEGAPALESMFLDEGFGTLDPEALDIVASAIEELGADGRMIGIVTHITELAERMPVRFEVTNESGAASVARIEGDR